MTRAAGIGCATASQSRGLAADCKGKPQCKPFDELAVLIAFGLQAAHDLDKSAPVLVYGRDLRVAASIANWLNDQGYSRVWLVTQ